jgi:hypothetical protein
MADPLFTRMICIAFTATFTVCVAVWAKRPPAMTVRARAAMIAVHFFMGVSSKIIFDDGALIFP